MIERLFSASVEPNVVTAKTRGKVNDHRPFQYRKMKFAIFITIYQLIAFTGVYFTFREIAKNKSKMAESNKIKVFFVVDGNGDSFNNLFYTDYNSALKVACKQNGLYIKSEMKNVCPIAPSFLAPCQNCNCYISKQIK